MWHFKLPDIFLKGKWPLVSTLGPHTFPEPQVYGITDHRTLRSRLRSFRGEGPVVGQSAVSRRRRRNWFKQTEALCLLCFFVNEATFGNNKYWFRELMPSAHPLQVSYPTPLHVHTSLALSTGGAILLKFKTFIHFF